MGALGSVLAPPEVGILVYSSGTLCYANDAARRLLSPGDTSLKDGSLEAIQQVARPLVEQRRETSANGPADAVTPSSATAGSSSTPEAPSATSSAIPDVEDRSSSHERSPASARFPRALTVTIDEAKAGDEALQIVQIRKENQTHRLTTDGPDATTLPDAAGYERALHPIYRAFAHDARNPIVASQLQLGILRELDGEDLADRSNRLADTLERHLDALSESLSLLVEELAPTESDGTSDVHAIVRRVGGLVKPYTRRESLSLKIPSADKAAFTQAQPTDVKKAVLGFLARLLPHADAGSRIVLDVDSAPTGGAVVILTVGGVMGTSDAARSALSALEDDAERCGGEIETPLAEGGTRVRLTLPGEEG